MKLEHTLLYLSAAIVFLSSVFDYGECRELITGSAGMYILLMLVFSRTSKTPEKKR